MYVCWSFSQYTVKLRCKMVVNISQTYFEIMRDYSYNFLSFSLNSFLGIFTTTAVSRIKQCVHHGLLKWENVFFFILISGVGDVVP